MKCLERFINNLLFTMKDRLIRFSATWLTLTFVVSILVIYNLGLKYDMWPYLPYPPSEISSIIVSLLYSYIVSYIFFILTIVLPRVIKLLNWYGYVMIRFNQFYDAWAVIYIIHHFYFKVGNSKVVEDIYVQSKAAMTDLRSLYNANRYGVALNLQNCLYQLETFSHLVSNQSDGIPSSLEVLFHEVTFNPIRANTQMVIDVLTDGDIQIKDAHDHALKSIKAFDEQFTNLKNLSRLLRHNIIVERHISRNRIFQETAHHVDWIIK